MNRPIPWVLTLFALAAACAPARRPMRPTPPPVSPIDTMALRAHTYFLAHDLLAGRGTGTPGADLAAAYIVGQCRYLGLQPFAGSFEHVVPLTESRPIESETALLVQTSNDSAHFFLNGHFLLAGGAQGTLRGFSGRAVWVGSAEDIATGADLPPLRNAVALTAGPVRRATSLVLQERGAVGMIHLIADSARYELYAASRGGSLMAVSDTAVESSFFAALPAALASPPLADVLLAAARRGGRVTLTVQAERRAIRAANIGCVLPGTQPDLSDTVIAFTAHYDHLGVSRPDARGDTIYNGFSDNAAGVAMLLAIADALRRGPGGGLRHSTAFLFFTGEERGLLGSDYFVGRPPIPLSQIRAVINLDAGAPPARPWSWRIAGGAGTSFGSLAMDVAASRGWSATTSDATPNSDYFPFTRHDVPAVFIIPGSAPFQGLTADSSNALRRRWDRYHQAGDEWHDDFPFSGLQRYAEYALMLALAVDRDPTTIRE